MDISVIEEMLCVSDDMLIYVGLDFGTNSPNAHYKCESFHQAKIISCAVVVVVGANQPSIHTTYYLSVLGFTLFSRFSSYYIVFIKFNLI